MPILLWDGMQAVQSRHFKRPHRPVGSMMQHIETMELRNIDELIILDVEATREGREPSYEAIEEYTSKLFCPLTVGGGVSKLEHIEKLLRSGADKIAINSAVYHNPEFVAEAVQKFGAQAIVASINSVYDHGVNIICSSDGAQTQGIPTRDVCTLAQELGVGEILLTDVWANGTMEGYNLDCLYECNFASMEIPMIVNGGCGKPEHMLEAMQRGASAVAASSMFLFRDVTPLDCSRYLNDNGFPTRLENGQAN